MKRVTWFIGGVATGAAGVGYAKRTLKRTVKRTATQLAPANVARGAMRKVKQKGRDVGDADARGPRCDARPRARVAGTPRRPGRDARRQLGPDDQLLVDGEPVETARVIVLRRAK